MYQFEIFTDSSADLPEEIIEQYHLNVMQLEVTIDNKEPVLNKDIEINSFYEQLRAGANAKTAAVTPGYFEDHMRECLESGKDILYVGFSSGLSATYNNGAMVIRELETEFPERKIYYIDTLCASAGQGLLVYYAAKLREKGVSAEKTLETFNYYHLSEPAFRRIEQEYNCTIPQEKWDYIANTPDRTHINIDGAKYVAKTIAELLAESDSTLAKFLK